MKQAVELWLLNIHKREILDKAKLVQEIANQTGLTKKTSTEAVDALISGIADCLWREERVTLVGFGTFQVAERKARRGRNPQAGEAIQIPGEKVPKFRPGKGLKERM